MVPILLRRAPAGCSLVHSDGRHGRRNCFAPLADGLHCRPTETKASIPPAGSKVLTDFRLFPSTGRNQLPVPDSWITVGLSGALERIVTEPGREPVAVGLKLPVRAQVAPGASDLGQLLLPL